MINPQEYVQSLLPICKKCNHKACINCRTWCDIILPNGELCCDGECEY